MLEDFFKKIYKCPRMSTIPSNSIHSVVATQANATIPCKYGSSCWTKTCPFTHPPKEVAVCKYGSSCWSKKCPFTHPPKEVAVCKYGSSCWKKDCHFSHEEPKEVQESFLFQDYDDDDDDFLYGDLENEDANEECAFQEMEKNLNPNPGDELETFFEKIEEIDLAEEFHDDSETFVTFNDQLPQIPTFPPQGKLAITKLTGEQVFKNF